MGLAMLQVGANVLGKGRQLLGSSAAMTWYGHQVEIITRPQQGFENVTVVFGG
jgi:hypothetical protein